MSPPVTTSQGPGTSEPCPVCRDLAPCAPLAASALDKNAWTIQNGLQPAPGSVQIQQIFFSSGLNPYHDIYQVKEYRPPWPQATKWIKSAIAGCTSCALVVEGTSRFVPFWFSEIGSTPGALDQDLFDNKIIIAMSFFGVEPLQIWLVDTSQPYHHRRLISLNMFTHPGECITSLTRS